MKRLGFLAAFVFFSVIFLPTFGSPSPDGIFRAPQIGSEWEKKARSSIFTNYQNIPFEGGSLSGSADVIKWDPESYAAYAKTYASYCTPNGTVYTNEGPFKAFPLYETALPIVSEVNYNNEIGSSSARSETGYDYIHTYATASKSPGSEYRNNDFFSLSFGECAGGIVTEKNENLIFKFTVSNVGDNACLISCYSYTDPLMDPLLTLENLATGTYIKSAYISVNEQLGIGLCTLGAKVYTEADTDGPSITSDFFLKIEVSRDACYLYNYKYTYNNGDYYEGTVYASPIHEYLKGYTEILNDEHGEAGFYEITGVSGSTQDFSKAGQVFVDRYYDKETDEFYTPLKKGTGVGTDYLGSEHDYIVKQPTSEPEKSNYYFGVNQDGKIAEADLNYAVLFSGGVNPQLNYPVYYHQTSAMWDLVVDTLNFDPENVYVLYADGSGDWKKVTDKGGTIREGTAASLQSALTEVKSEISNKGCFYFWSYDHGDNLSYENHDKPVKDDAYLCGWGENDRISDEQLASWVSGMPAKAETYALAQCFARGMADNLLAANNKTRFVAWSSDYYELSFYFIGQDWAEAWAAGLAGGINSTHALGSYAWKNDLLSPFGSRDPLGLDLISRYDFKFYFPGGDHYEGWVYTRPVEHPGYGGGNFDISTGKAAPAVTPPQVNPDNPYKSYYQGQKLGFPVEGNKKGYYEIIGYRVEGKDLASGQADGAVFVDWYYDSKTKVTYGGANIVNITMPIGSVYLGSEHSYLFQEGIEDYFFGARNGVIYEADVHDKFSFKHLFSQGDYYTGTIYGSPDMVSSIEGYEITGAGYSGDASKYGQVFVDKYYDKESNKTYTPLNSKSAASASGLGSEEGYLVKNGVTNYHFSKTDSADFETCYDFKFTLTNGDYYIGQVYALPEQGYRSGYTKASGIGTYEITKAKVGSFPGKSGEVYVSKYYDAESKKTYTPVNSKTSLGNQYLGSEGGSIIKSGIDYYAFNNSREADVEFCYDFKFTYSQGDYYLGKVYALPDKGYSLGYTLPAGNGSYAITKVSLGKSSGMAGQVFVSKYYDAKTKKSFTPVNSKSPSGMDLMGSEEGFIIQSGVEKYHFSCTDEAEAQ